MAHPGLPGLPGLGPTAGLPVATSTSAALLGLGLPPISTTAPGTVTAVHSLSMLGKPDIHRGQPDDLKSSGGKLSVYRYRIVTSTRITAVQSCDRIVYTRGVVSTCAPLSNPDPSFRNGVASYLKSNSSNYFCTTRRPLYLLLCAIRLSPLVAKERINSVASE